MSLVTLPSLATPNRIRFLSALKALVLSVYRVEELLKRESAFKERPALSKVLTEPIGRVLKIGACHCGGFMRFRRSHPDL